MAARSSLRRVIQKTTAEGDEQPGGVQRRRPSGRSAQGEHDLDRQIDRGGRDQPEGIRAGDQLDHEGGEDDRHGQDDVRIRGDAVHRATRGCGDAR